MIVALWRYRMLEGKHLISCEMLWEMHNKSHELRTLHCLAGVSTPGLGGIMVACPQDSQSVSITFVLCMGPEGLRDGCCD